jgi:hypothetical protein
MRWCALLGLGRFAAAWEAGRFVVTAAGKLPSQPVPACAKGCGVEVESDVHILAAIASAMFVQPHTGPSVTA